MKIGARLKPLAALCALAVTTLSWAHHSTAAFNYHKDLTLTGEVKEFKWTYPHMFLDVAVSDGQGQTKLWSVEVGTPNLNVRHGWKKTDLKPGDKVTMLIHPLRDESKAEGTLVNITLPDGRVLRAPGGDIVVAEPKQ